MKVILSLRLPVRPTRRSTKVDFYSDDLFLGTASKEPYSVTVNNLPPGTNQLYAVVTDGIGLTASSPTVNVAVFNLGMTVVSPADGAILNANPTTIRAVAVLPSGTMTKVEFLVDGETVGEDETEPYSIVWSSVTPGLHRLSARGTDELGNTYLSTLVWVAVAEPLVPNGSVWKYLDDGSDQGTNWITADFDDGEWSTGPAELGYGDGDEATVVSYGPDENNKYITTYFRRAFVVDNPATFASLTLSLERDDGGVVYLNGKEVFRTDNLPAAPEVITFTNLTSGFGIEDTVDVFNLNVADLVAGTNVLAVEIHQESGTSSDISFNLQLVGIPEIIRNQLPVIHFLNVADGDWFFTPAQVVLDVEASDPDGTITNLALFQGNTLLAESTESPLAFRVNELPPGIFHFSAMASDNGGAINTRRIEVTVYERSQEWVAYNDHYAGPNTHPYATAWNAFGTADGAPGDEGMLRNIANGHPVPAFLNIFALGTMGDSLSGAPPPGTPAYETFNGFVDFGSGEVNHAIVLSRDSVVFHFFSGLDPDRRYNFRGTAVGGVPDFKNRWTLFTIVGARAFTPAHTDNVLTSETSPGALYPDEAAMNTGDNSTGDMVGWDNIAPGEDGTFTIVSTLYQGPAPGNDPPGPYAYAPVAVRVEEVGAVPYVVLTEPTGYDYYGFTDLDLAATASAVEGITNVLFLANGTVIGSDATAPYRMVWPDATFGELALTALAMDASGQRATSAVVHVVINPPPTNTIAPVIAAVDPERGAALTELTTIEVTFSEDVYGVAAADLLINGTPATAVSGSGSNYLFTVTAPAYGNVRITWSPLHGIVDKGYPTALPFDHTGPGARWNYAMLDRVAPTVAVLDPPLGASLTNLTQITIVFSEPVTGVDASDLLVRNAPATAVAGSGTTYTFVFPPQVYGLTIVRWAGNHGITDLATPANAYVASPPTWTYVVNANSVLVQTNSDWRLMRGVAEASDPMGAWRQFGFDDSSWEYLQAPMFYGDPYETYNEAGTLLGDMRGHYSSIFLRKEFQVTKALSLTNMLLKAQSDDAFIAWINGVEVYRSNVSLGDLPHDATASSEVAETAANGVPTVIYTLPDPFGYMREGTNVLAIQAFNYGATNDDFNFDAQLYCYRYSPSLVTPGVIRVSPPASSLFALTNITVTFNESVSGVDAADLLVNGVPAASVIGGASNDVYTFSFPQPTFGAVAITWAANHGIADFDASPRAFSGTTGSATWQYNLLNPSAPIVTTQVPAAGTTVSSLTEITVTFNEPVMGVQAEDLRINGVPAGAVSGDGATYTFTFAPPAYGAVFVTWSSTHTITDTENPPVPFTSSAPGSTWSYTYLDQIPPAVAAQMPTTNEVAASFTQVTVTFTEAVRGVDASDLLINGVPATDISGNGAVYTFSFPQPNASVAVITWAVGHGIYDQAFPINNAFDATVSSSTWAYQIHDNIPPELVSVNPLPDATVRGLTQIIVTFNETVEGVDATDLLLNGTPASSVSGMDTDYTFHFDQPEPGLVQVSWADHHEIQDLASPPNPLVAEGWTYLLDTNAPPPTITRGPYLQIQTASSIIVRWRTAVATDSGVRYGPDPYSRTNAVNDFALTTEHIVTVTNLPADTKFYYAIGTTDGAMLADTNYFFRTAPIPGISRPTRIWFISDYGFRNTGERQVRDSYFNYVAPEKPADVWITGGDNDQTDGSDSHYSDSVFGTTYAYGDLLAHQVIWPTIGNHDYQSSQGQYYYANFSLPANGEAGGVASGTEHYYSYDYNDIHFVSLDSIDGTLSRSSETPMIDWLREDLAATTQRWIIAYWHGPAYTKGSHDSDSTTDTLAWMTQMRENVVPVLESNGVDLVLCGHSHVYERSWLLQGHYGLSTTFSETNKVDGGDGKVEGDGAYLKPDGTGTVYVTAALGGDPQNHTTAQHPAHRLKVTDVLGSLVIDVNSNRLDLQWLNTSGVTQDHFTIDKTPHAAPPSAPSGLTGTKTGSSVALAWQNTPTNEMGFKVERGTDALNFSEIAEVGANLTKYTDASVPAGTTWFYRVLAWNDAGSSPYPPIITVGAAAAPILAEQPQSQTNVIGSTASFTVAVAGTAPLSYQWRFNGELLADATNATLVLADVQPAHAGEYTVRITNAQGLADSDVATLTVVEAPLGDAPVITAAPQNQAVPLGGNVTFHVVAEGTPPMTCQWFEDGVLLPGETSTSLTLLSVQADVAGREYAAVVSNLYGKATSAPPAKLTVVLPPAIDPPVITGDGTSFTFTVPGAAGVNQIVEYKDQLGDQTPWQMWTNFNSAESLTITVPIDPEQPGRFYRVRVSVP